MNTWIVLLRGINVGGRNKLPMNKLKALLEEKGCRNVQTYIQSGNVVFRHQEADPRRLERGIAAAIASAHTVEPGVLALSARELERAVAGNPFREADKNPQSLHLFFLASVPKKPDEQGLDALRAKSERFRLQGRVFYLHAPEGFGISKLAARAERLLGVAATARNWRTVTKLVDLAANVL